MESNFQNPLSKFVNILGIVLCDDVPSEAFDFAKFAKERMHESKSCVLQKQTNDIEIRQMLRIFETSRPNYRNNASQWELRSAC